MKRIFSISIICIFVFAGAVHSQNDTSKLYGYVRQAEAIYARQSYDSALAVYLSAFEIIKKRKLYSDVISCIIVSGIGNCYNQKNNIAKANQYFNFWLLTAKEYKYEYEKQQALTALAELQRKIVEKDLSFNYPPVSATQKDLAIFSFEKIKPIGDSLEITLLGGRYDGISDLTLTAEVYTSINFEDTVHHTEINFYGKCYINRLENNRTIIHVKNNSTIKLLKTDFVFIDVNVPLSWKNLSLRNLLLRNIVLKNNYQEQLYNYRFFYYYNDSLLEKETLEMMETAISEVAKEFSADTLADGAFSQKIEAGIFAGMNVIRAMNDSKPEHIKLYLNYINNYPAPYLNHHYKFSEIYGSWIFKNTELVDLDVKPYLLNISSTAERRKEIYNLRSVFKQEDLINKWLDDGMQQTNIENITEAKITAALVNDAVIATTDNYNKGWYYFLLAIIEKRMSNDKKADSLLLQSSNNFKQENNKEGEAWASSTFSQWKKGSKINIGVQSGHLFPYIIAESANTRYFATGGKDNLIKIWDRSLNKEILTLREHTDEINSLDFSANGRYLVSTADDSTICVWNAFNYTLLHKFKATGIVRSAKFSPDSKFIVTAGEDSIIRFRDLQTGAIVKQLNRHKGKVLDIAFNPQVPTRMYSCGTDSMVYRWDLETDEMIHWYKQKGKVLCLNISNGAKYIAMLCTDSAYSIRDLESGEKVYNIKIHTYEAGGTTNYSTGSFSADGKYFIYANSKDSFSVVDLNDYYERIYPTLLKDYDLSDLIFSKDGVSLFARFDMNGPLRIYNFAGFEPRTSPTISYKNVKTFANMVTEVQFTNDDNNLIIQDIEVGKIDLRNGNYERLFYGPSIPENKYLLLHHENLGTYFPTYTPVVNFYDYKNRNVTQTFSLPDSEKINCYEMTPDDEYCYLGSEKGLVACWDTKNNKQLFSKKYTSGDTKIIKLNYDVIMKRLFIITEEGNIIVVNSSTGEITSTIKQENANYVAVSPQFIYVTSEDGYLYKHDFTSLALVKKILLNADHGVVEQPVLSPDFKYLLLRTVPTDITAINTINDSVLYQIPDHEYTGGSISISHNGKLIATSGFSSEVNLYETATGKKIVTLYLPMDKGVLITDTDGHYLASKNTLEAIQFTYNNNAYTFDQFDVQFNRPDLILQKMGKADTSLLKTYSMAWKKRLSRLNISEKDLSDEIHLPLVKLQDKFAVPPVTTQKEYELTIDCSDSRFPLQSCQVLVNNSPVLGLNGKNLSSQNTQFVTEKIKVLLSNGNNNIKVYCTNSKGAVSLKESFDIISKYKTDAAPKSYFIGIAVADYKDKRMNLGYSVKDIRDLAKTFDKIYYNTVIDTLINFRATKENILALKKKLMQTTVNDRVILAVTGHGLLSDSLDFYYGTWDIDFKKPELRGLKYDDLENLLTDIPARQKLMLIDACHSGALDKDELMALKKDTTTVTMVSETNDEQVKGIAPRGIIVNKQSKMNANSSFEMMQHLFTDVSVSNGAVIISAAGGMEYAFESDKWNNGVFTYCIRKGIEEKRADTDGGNSDGSVSVQELLDYVSRKVSELTNGKQKPTSRRENIDYEWMIRNL